ncbi:MAG: hypothetical protein EOP09_18500, partial [Proteobacteria bacterium]
MIGLATLLAVTSAWAGPYGSDFNKLVTALEVGGKSTKNLWKFQDPDFGATDFMLPQENAPWAGNYSPMKDGGIARRQDGNSANPQNLPTKEQVKRMSPKEIANLSPAEKMDILNGDFEYKITLHELNVRGPYRALQPAYWEGFCNGVRCAGFLTPEPVQTIEVVSPDGIKLKFLPSDLKGLAGASFFYIENENYVDIGKPTRGDQRGSNRPNFGVVYLTLKYYLAEMKQAFVIDMSLDSELWNETAAGFKMKQTPRQALTVQESIDFPNARHKVLVKIRLKTLGEVSVQRSNSPTKKSISQGKLLKETPMSGYLYLDREGKIIDGAWRDNTLDSSENHWRGVDFMWFAAGKGADAKF